jgi:deoxyribodipyrimidine photo-lyase
MEIPREMIRPLNRKQAPRGDYVLYWMQQSQRAEYNPALAFAAMEANRRSLPLVVVFGLTADYPEANRRHYTFMLEGLRETQADLAARGIRMIVHQGHPPEAALAAGKHAAAIICDRGYLRHQRQWRQEVARAAQCPVIQIEADAILPVETVYPKAAYNARILRLKINALLEYFLIPWTTVSVKSSSLDMDLEGIEIQEVDAVLAALEIDDDAVPPSPIFTGGTSHAKQRFEAFLEKSLAVYDRNSNQPQQNDVSGMSPYLHFGQISPIWLALKVQRRQKDCPEGAAAYLEELVVRRELAINYVHYTSDYDRYSALPSWARKTLQEHRGDERPDLYSLDALEKAQTHDPYWNAAMKEMVFTGFMHNYMRMYWGKKVLEWSRTPEEAFDRLLTLNNRYFIDGRDPNSYAGVAWIFGLHDRAWKERPIFGKVRYMAATGLERKCDIQAYVRGVEAITGGAGSAPPDG